MLSFLLVRKMFPDGAHQGKVGGQGGTHDSGKEEVGLASSEEGRPW